MISLMPDELLVATCHLVCYGFAGLTAVAAFLLTPRW
jgi:hypothetical protein